jgi:hypothetical protein
MHSFNDCVLMVCFVNWLLRKLEAMVFLSFYSGYLFLDSFIFILAGDWVALNSIYYVLHELTPFHETIAVDVNLGE